jgi:hypothetical protein
MTNEGTRSFSRNEVTYEFGMIHAYLHGRQKEMIRKLPNSSKCIKAVLATGHESP